MLGKGKVMSCEDLEQARTVCAARDAKKEASAEAKKAKRAKKDSKGWTSPAGGISKRKLVRKHANDTEAHTVEGEEITAPMNQIGVQEFEHIGTPWLAPVAKMW